MSGYARHKTPVIVRNSQLTFSTLLNDYSALLASLTKPLTQRETFFHLITVEQYLTKLWSMTTYLGRKLHWLILKLEKKNKVDQDIFGGLSFVGQAQAEPYEERATPCCWTINLVLQQCLFCSPDFHDIMMAKPSGTLYWHSVNVHSCQTSKHVNTSMFNH